MELIIAILFFSLAAAICIQLFVKSHTISERSIALNHSILLAQNTAEIFYATDGDLTEMASLLGCRESSGTTDAADSDSTGTLTLFYTDEFDPLDPVKTASGSKVSSGSDPDSEQTAAMQTDQAMTSLAVYQQEISLSADSDPALITCHIVISEISSEDVIYSLDTTLFQRDSSSSTAAEPVHHNNTSSVATEPIQENSTSSSGSEPAQETDSSTTIKE